MRSEAAGNVSGRAACCDTRQHDAQTHGSGPALCLIPAHDLNVRTLAHSDTQLVSAYAPSAGMLSYLVCMRQMGALGDTAVIFVPFDTVHELAAVVTGMCKQVYFPAIKTGRIVGATVDKVPVRFVFSGGSLIGPAQMASEQLGLAHSKLAWEYIEFLMSVVAC